MSLRILVQFASEDNRTKLFKEDKKQKLEHSMYVINISIKCLSMACFVALSFKVALGPFFLFCIVFWLWKIVVALRKKTCLTPFPNLRWDVNFIRLARMRACLFIDPSHWSYILADWVHCVCYILSTKVKHCQCMKISTAVISNINVLFLGL